MNPSYDVIYLLKLVNIVNIVCVCYELISDKLTECKSEQDPSPSTA